MNKQFKRIIALTLCVIMLFGVSPVNGLAELDFSRLASVSVDFAPVKALFSRISDLHIPEIRLPDFSEMLALKASADDPVADIVPNFNAETGTLTLSGTGKMPNYTSSSRPEWYEYKQSIFCVVINEGITSIGNRAFYSCANLTSIALPESIVSIGQFAFDGCTSLESITIPENVTSIGGVAFQNCKSLVTLNYKAINCADFYNNLSTASWYNLETVSFGNHVERIPAYAFYKCTKLRNITTIPDSVTSIGSYAYYQCTSLEELILPNSVLSIDSYAFKGCASLKEVVLPDRDVSMGDYAFQGCEKLESIDIPNSFTDLTTGVFSDCTSLKSVVIPKNIKKCAGAFSGCTNLTEVIYNAESATDATGAFNNTGSNCGISITIGENVKNIPNHLLNGSIKSLKILSPAPTFGWFLFEYCTGIKTAGPIDDGNDYDYEFCWSESIPDYAFSKCYELESVVIPDTVSSIGSFAFQDCRLLEEISLPGNLTNIGDSAFKDCISLKEISLPDNNLSIGESAFQGCASIKNVTIPENVSTIGRYVFNGCEELETFTFNAKNCGAPSNAGGIPPRQGWFAGCPKLNAISIGNQVQNIPGYAFYNCTGLSSVTIPDSVSAIGNNAFYNCAGLTEINYYAENVTSGYAIFYNSGTQGDGISLTIGKDVKKIPSFSGANIIFVKILSNTATVERSAFSGCDKLKTAGPIDDGNDYDYVFSWTASIPENAFRGCNGLTDITLPESIVSIGQFAFDGCTLLKSITIPENVTYLGAAAFQNCKNLVTLNYNAINCSGFNNNAVLVSWTSLETVYFGDKVKTIPEKSFLNCYNLNRIVISDSVTSIGYRAFEGCSGLSSVTIPDSVTSIGYNAFLNVCNISYDTDKMTATGSPWGARSVNGYIDGNLIYSDKSMTELLACSPAAKGLVIVPASVQTVADKAFFNCKDIERIVFKMRDAEPPAFGSNVFLGCSKLTDVTLLPFGDGSEVKGDIIFGDYGRRLIFCNRDRGENESEKTYTIPDYVEVIEDNAFANCTKLNVIIPENNNIVSVGSNAFYNTTVNGVPFNTATRTVTGDGKAEYLLVSGILLEVKKIGDENFSFSIPSGTTCIAAEAFKELPGLTSVTIPSGVRGIGRDAFSGCSSLAGVTANTNSLIYVGANAFDSTPFYDNATGSLYVGNALVKAAPDGSFTVTGTCVADGAMKNCETLEALNLNNVEYIGKSAFENCGNLSTVTFGSGLVSIGDHAFAETGISGNVVIPSSVENIGYCAFKNCAEITGFEADGNNNVFTDNCGVLFVKATDKVTGNSKIILVQYPAGRTVEPKIYDLPEKIDGSGVSKIEDYAFSYAKLSEVTTGSTYFRTLAFANCAAVRNTSSDDSEWVDGKIEYKENRTVLCQVTAEALEDGSFTVPGSVLVIAPRAFSSVGNDLKSVNLNGTRIISESAFAGCKELSAVTGFDNVVFIGDLAFADCEKIEEVSLPNKIYCSPTAFVNIPKNYLKIQVADNVAYGDSVTLSTDYTPGENEKIIWIWTECEFNGDEMTPVDKTAEGKQITINNVSHNITVSAYLVEVEDVNAEVTHGRTASGITFENATVIMGSDPDVPVIINAEITERQHDITKVDVIYANIGDKVPLSLGADKEADNQELENLINDYGDILEIRWYSGKDKDIKQIGTGPSCEITVAKYGKVTLTVKFIYTGGKKEIGLATITKSITFKKPDSAVSIKAKSAEVYNNSVVTVKATASGVPDGCVLAIYEGKKLMQKGDSKSVTYEIPGKLTKDKTLTVKIIDGQGKVQKDANGKEISEKIEIKIKSGFFNMIIAFFRMLFGLNKVTIEP